MNYIITEEELTSLEKTGNPLYRKSVEYVIGRIRSRPVMSDLEDVITKQIDYANGMQCNGCPNDGRCQHQDVGDCQTCVEVANQEAKGE